MELAPALPASVDLEAELVRVYPALIRRLTFVLRDTDAAEDIVQAAFVRALEHRAKFSGGDVRAWFYTIALRLASNELRRRRTAATRQSDGEASWAMSTDPDLWMALDDLPPEYRAALVLSSLEGYSHDEIARMLNVRPGTVSSWLSRTRDRLRLVLGNDDE